MTSQIILLILGIIIVAILLTQRGRAGIRGICAAAVGVDAPSFAKWLRMGKKKRENKEKILELLRAPFDSAQGKRELTNADIREALGISDRSVVRYMDELEKEGKVEQVGATGRGVAYRLKPQKTQQ